MLHQAMNLPWTLLLVLISNNFVSSLFVPSIFQCPSQDNTQSRLKAYFFVLGGIQLIFMLVLIVCQKKFNIIKLNPQQVEPHQFLSTEFTSSVNGREPIMYS